MRGRLPGGSSKGAALFLLSVLKIALKAALHAIPAVCCIIGLALPTPVRVHSDAPGCSRVRTRVEALLFQRAYAFGNLVFGFHGRIISRHGQSPLLS
ncbi:hypothetical protein BES08_27850 (plasmid) [Novosphingobium resinovorum]|uniref:Uncharacterized protein n=1 Tax=Novosphingobium resinovorum TaxID=158500 RepID=A0A1D8AEX0_9SPHN|nr:hypothetical protein BES08_27850 [Novosphingobium resinovorum]